MSSETSESRVNQIKRVLDKMPKRAKEAFILSKIHHLKYKQIAEEMEISIKTVEKHISKALRYFKENMDA